MSIIWWTLYLIGAITVVILWINIMTLIRMEVAAYLAKLEISRTTFPGLGEDKINIRMSKEEK